MPETDITTIKRYPVVATYGSDQVGPSEGNPEISFDIQKYESVCHEEGEGVDPVASIITKKNAVIKITTKNLDYAMELIDSFDVGDDIFDDDNSNALTLTPVVAVGVTEKTMVFTNCFFDPGSSSYTPKAGEDHVAVLTFVAKPDGTTGKLYTWT